MRGRGRELKKAKEWCEDGLMIQSESHGSTALAKYISMLPLELRYERVAVEKPVEAGFCVVHLGSFGK